MAYRLIFMGFDGEYKKDSNLFASVSEAWDYSNDIGSRWFFYPFHFVVTESGLTIKESAHGLEFFNGKRLKTVAKQFNSLSKLEYTQNLDVDGFAFALFDQFA
jgi:hypothetical protein